MEITEGRRFNLKSLLVNVSHVAATEHRHCYTSFQKVRQEALKPKIET